MSYEAVSILVRMRSCVSIILSVCLWDSPSRCPPAHNPVHRTDVFILSTITRISMNSIVIVSNFAQALCQHYSVGHFSSYAKVFPERKCIESECTMYHVWLIALAFVNIEVRVCYAIEQRTCTTMYWWMKHRWNYHPYFKVQTIWTAPHNAPKYSFVGYYMPINCFW